MSKAKEIAEERFAKGEITKEEYQDILSNLSGANPQNVTQEPVKPAGGSPSSFRWKPLALMTTGIFLFIGINRVTGDIMKKCLRGSSLQWCEGAALNKPMVYGSYVLCAMLVGWGFYTLIRRQPD